MLRNQELHKDITEKKPLCYFFSHRFLCSPQQALHLPIFPPSLPPSLSLQTASSRAWANRCSLNKIHSDTDKAEVAAKVTTWKRTGSIFYKPQFMLAAARASMLKMRGESTKLEALGLFETLLIALLTSGMFETISKVTPQPGMELRGDILRRKVCAKPCGGITWGKHALTGSSWNKHKENVD